MYHTKNTEIDLNKQTTHPRLHNFSRIPKGLLAQPSGIVITQFLTGQMTFVIPKQCSSQRNDKII